MAQDGQVLAADAAPVVLDLEQLNATVFNCHNDLRRAGVQAVLQHLFERGAWPLDDLPCRYPVHHVLIKFTDRLRAAGAALASRRRLRRRLGHGAKPAVGRQYLALVRMRRGSAAATCPEPVPEISRQLQIKLA